MTKFYAAIFDGDDLQWLKVEAEDLTAATEQVIAQAPWRVLDACKNKADMLIMERSDLHFVTAGETGFVVGNDYDAVVLRAVERLEGFGR